MKKKKKKLYLLTIKFPRLSDIDHPPLCKPINSTPVLLWTTDVQRRHKVGHINNTKSTQPFGHYPDQGGEWQGVDVKLLQELDFFHVTCDVRRRVYGVTQK